jgi:predicted dehydrogenase
MLTGAVIGFGSVGQALTARVNGRSDARITAVCDINKARLDLAQNMFSVAVQDEVQKVLEIDLDFVLVTSPNAAHSKHVIAAARAGKHVFCEKPIALNLSDADAMIEACRAANIIDFVNYSLRFTRAYQKLHELVVAGEFGEILSLWRNTVRGYPLYSSGFRHFAVCNPDISGGWAVHCACHAIDILYWLGGPVTTVYGQTNTSVPGASSEEIVQAVLRFENGAVGMIQDTMCPIFDNTGGIVGTRGSALFHQHNRSEAPVLRIKLDGKTEEHLETSDGNNEMALDLFFGCIRTGQPSPSTLKEARNSLAIALAIQESNRTGTVIQF